MYSKKAFKMAVVASVLVLVAVMLTLTLKTTNRDISAFVGFFMMAGCVFGMIGAYFSIRGFKEKTTKGKIAATTVNFGMTLLLIAVILANVVDVAKLFV